jgi:hypothetical protein
MIGNPPWVLTSNFTVSLHQAFRRARETPLGVPLVAWKRSQVLQITRDSLGADIPIPPAAGYRTLVFLASLVVLGAGNHVAWLPRREAGRLVAPR